MSKRGRGVVGKIGRAASVEAVTPEEAKQLTELQDVRQKAETALKRAQIAYETAALDFAEVEGKISRKYKLNRGDFVLADGKIQRQSAAQ